MSWILFLFFHKKYKINIFHQFKKDRERIRKVMSDKLAEKEKEIEDLEIQLETSTHVREKKKKIRVKIINLHSQWFHIFIFKGI